MVFIALSPRTALRPRASVQQLPYIPRARDITIMWGMPVCSSNKQKQPRLLIKGCELFNVASFNFHFHEGGFALDNFVQQ